MCILYYKDILVPAAYLEIRSRRALSAVTYLPYAICSGAISGYLPCWLFQLNKKIFTCAERIGRWVRPVLKGLAGGLDLC